MKIKPIKQKNGLACGPTCIFLVDRYFGGNAGFKEIEKITQYKSKGGLDDADIVAVLNRLGYQAKRLKNCTWEDIVKYNTDESVLIVSWMLDGYKGHVSIVDKVVGDNIYLIDSEEGKVIKMNKIKFMRLWMEYDGHDWPNVPGDISLRTMIVVNK